MAVNRQKLKLLYLMRMLQEETDSEQGLTMTQILERLEEEGVMAERKSVYRDIEALREFGLDIRTYQRSPVEYALENRDFALPELLLLVDAVQPALGRALLAHPGVGAPQGEGVELLQAVRAEGLGYPLDLVGLPVPRERAPELVLALLVEAHRVFPDGDVARPHRRGVHDLGAVLHQRLGRFRLGAVHGAAGRLPVLARHGVLAERDPDAPRVLPARLLHRP